jgi:hypothetical protein
MGAGSYARYNFMKIIVAGKYLPETVTEILVEIEDATAAAVRRLGADDRRGQLSEFPGLAGFRHRPGRSRQARRNEFVGDQRELYLLEQQPDEEAAVGLRDGRRRSALHL